MAAHYQKCSANDFRYVGCTAISIRVLGACVRRVIQNKETDRHGKGIARARPSSKLDLESGFVAFHHKRPSFFLCLLPTMKSWLIKETLPFSSCLLPSSLFAIVIVVPEIPNEVTSFISGPQERTECTDA